MITTANRNPLKRLYNWVLHWAQTKYAVPALFTLSFVESSVFPIPPDVLMIALCMGLPKRWFFYAAVTTVASVLGGLFGYSIGFFLSDSLGQILLEWVGMLTVHGDLASAQNYLNLSEKLLGLATTLNMDQALLTASQGANSVANMLLSNPDYALSASEKALWCRGEAMYWYKGEWGAWAVGIAGFTPIPYKLFTITAGLFDMNVGVFTIASTIGRASRFFMVCGFIGLTYKYFGNRLQEIIEKYFNWFAVAFTLLLLGGFYVLRFLK